MNNIIERTQERGRGVKVFEGREDKLKRLTQATRERRSRAKNLSTKTSPWKSNLTFTGELLDSLYHKVSGLKIQIRIRGAKSKNKAIHVSKDRPFMNLSGKQVRNLLKLYNDLVRKVL